METNRSKSIQIGDFAGMTTDVDPRDLDKNGLQMALNVSFETPGVVKSRRGFIPQVVATDTYYSDWTGTKTAHIVTRDVLDNPVFIAWQSNGTNGQMLAGNAEATSPESSTKNRWKALHDSTRGYLSASYSKPTIARTSAGEVFVANGYDYMMKWGGRIGSTPYSHVTSKTGNQFLPAGIDAPTAGPTIALASTASNMLAGDYLFAYRYLDYEGNPSNLSPVTTASATVSGNSASWTISGPSTLMPSYDRIATIEAFRTPVGVADVFYRIGSYSVGTTTISDTLSDDALRDLEALPIQNADGSVNANRFGTPPLKPIIAWHQDRMYAAGSIVLTAGTVSVNSGASTGTGSSTTFKPSMAGWEMTFDADGADETYATTAFSSSTAFTLARTSATTFSSVDFALRPSRYERNTLYYSEADEPESWPVEQNYFILQADSTGTYDEPVVALMSYGPTLYAMKPTVMYQVDSVTQPNLDVQVSPAFQRGCLNQQCWAQVDGIAFIMDRLGCYAFDHSQPEPIGDAIGNYFHQNLIDFSKSANFFVSANRKTRTVRFHVALAGKNDYSNYPMWAFVYHYRVKKWSLDRYPWGVTGAGSFKKSDGSEVYYLLPEGYPPMYESANLATDGCSEGFVSFQSATSGGATVGNDYTASVLIAGAPTQGLTLIGCPIAYTGKSRTAAYGTGDRVYGVITSYTSPGLYKVRFQAQASPLSTPATADELYVGGIPYELKTKQFDIAESPEGTRREIGLWYKPQNTITVDYGYGGWSTVANLATTCIRHYVDGSTSPVLAASTTEPLDEQAALVDGSANAFVAMNATRAGMLTSGVARKQFGPSVLMHDVPASRTVEIEIKGVAAEERHQFTQLDIEGAA